MLDINKLNQSLNLLNDRLKIEQAPPAELVVCGGSALIFTGVVTRTTKDVDIVALAKPGTGGNELLEAKPLPDYLKKAAEQVALDLGLDANWLNDGPADLLKYGLPQGFENRLQTKVYGQKLTVHFISRVDQIHFKVYAAVDSGPGRHVDDLLALKPTTEEMESAARWVVTHDPSEEFKDTLKKMLKSLKYESVAEHI